MIKLRNLHFNIKILHHDLSKKSLTYLERAQQEVPLFKVLVEKLTKNFSIQGKSSSTLHNYTRCLSHLALYYKQCPTLLTLEQVQEYLYYCQQLHKTPSESFFKHTIYGLRAVYKLYGKTALKLQLPQIKRHKDLPVILNQSEVKALIQAPRYLKHKVMIATLYGCGLRSYELCNLQLSDIDFERQTMFVKKQKGKTDRYVPLGNTLAYALKKYIKAYRPSTHLFYSQSRKASQQLGITTTGVNWAVKEAKSKLKTKKKITAHTLRHTYATHLLEQGVDLIRIQKLLGHAYIETTMVYLHVAQFDAHRIHNPLDRLYPVYANR